MPLSSTSSGDLGVKLTIRQCSVRLHRCFTIHSTAGWRLVDEHIQAARGVEGAAEAADVAAVITEGHVLEFTALIGRVQQSTIDRVH